jgi:lipopolysaccharide/colanic/teichoic acid biosynthesis glycosyltransferase
LFACILAIPGLPIIGLLMVLVRLTSRGPAIYSQVRVGKDNKPYTMYKLRSMRIDAEDNSGPVWSQEDDPRVTPIGRFLRDRHLDELPQLINVIRGEMDLFGPRPERPEFTAVLTSEIPVYADRVKVLPGITGLAQINLPPDSDLESVRNKLNLDLEYIEEATFWLDARMFFATFLRLMGIPGESVMRIAKLKRDEFEITPLPENPRAEPARGS